MLEYQEHKYWMELLLGGDTSIVTQAFVDFWGGYRSASHPLLLSHWSLIPVLNSAQNSLDASTHIVNMLGNTCKIWSALNIASLAVSSSALLPQVKSRSTKT